MGVARSNRVSLKKEKTCLDDRSSLFNGVYFRFLYTIRNGVSGIKIASSGAAIFRQIAKDGNLANAGAAEGATTDGGDRRGESCQSHS